MNEFNNNQFVELSSSVNAPLPTIAVLVPTMPSCKNERVLEVLNRIPPYVYDNDVNEERGEVLGPH